MVNKWEGVKVDNRDKLELVIKNTWLNEKICKKYLKNNYDIETIFKEIQDKIKLGHIEIASAMAGKIYGNVSNASTIYGMDKFNTPRGHGFAEENANHLYDKVSVKLTGEEFDSNTGSIIKNGADRVVDGINIQTKYCSSGSKCSSECFENGKLRYLNPDGTPM